MLEEIARTQGIRCVNTLTGFKWMAEKLADYEDAATAALLEKEGISWEYETTDFHTRAEILLRYSNFTVFAAEESYGYLPLDIVRDKDGNASALALVEMLAHLNSIDSAPLEFLENLYRKHGYFEESTANFYFEGATGAAAMHNIIESYSEKTPSEINGIPVRKAKNFGKPGYLDEDEKPLAIENFFIFELENDYIVAVRASGTEPKIKYYLFGRAKVSDRDSLTVAKNEVGKNLEALAKWAKVDANERGGVASRVKENDPPRESETAEKKQASIHLEQEES